MITYVTGDATTPPPSDGIRVIAHICNDAGAWGAGFVLALSRRDSHPEEEYRQWSLLPDFQLGEVRLASFAEPRLFVANMIAQQGFGEQKGEEFIPPIRYVHLSCCLARLHRTLERSTVRPVSIHMPRIGCGLGGGTWDKIEPLIEQFLSKRGIPVTVYDPPNPHTVDIGSPGPCCGPNGCETNK